MAESLRLIVAITGMPGAGKSTAAEALVKEGWKRVVMGDVIREETRRRGLVADAKNTGEVMKALRREMGEAAVARLCLDRIEKLGAQRVVVDGIRSVAEAQEFRETAKVVLIAIHASRLRRFELLKERGRSDDPLSYEMFLSRDERELGIGIASAIALADETISNEHSTPKRLAKEMTDLVERWASGLVA